MPVNEATVDDLATAANVLYRLEVRRQSFVDDLPDSWRDAAEAMGADLRQIQHAMIDAHRRETGEAPSHFLSRTHARRCRLTTYAEDDASIDVECGQPSGWRLVAPDATTTYACPDHEAALRSAAEVLGARVERLLS